MRPYVTSLPVGYLTLGMNKIALFPFGMRISTPWDSLPRSLVNAFVHTYESGPCRNCVYSCDIPVMELMPVLASNFLHASCDVGVCVARVYLGAFWNPGGCCGYDGSMIVTLGDGAVVGIGNGSTLRSGAVVGMGVVPTLIDVVGALVGIHVTSTPCRVLMDCILSSPTANGYSGVGLFGASASSSTYWRAASADKFL